MENRRAWVEIDLDALRENFRAIRQRVGRRGILVPVKADGYGHGSVEVSRVFAEEGVNMLGVASSGEGMDLRSGGITLPILILSPSTLLDIPAIFQEDLTPTVVDWDFALHLSREAQKIGRRVKVHVEVETGMGRTGIDFESAPEFILALTELKNLQVDGVFTHFASAEEKEKSYTLKQLKRFEKVVTTLKEKGYRIPYLHTANSAALLELPQTYFNLVRPGLLNYGLYPSEEVSRSIPVKRVMTFKTRVVQLKKVDKGISISYGRTYTTERDSLIAVLSVGYGDGFVRSLSNRGEVLIQGMRAKVVGTVCMDLTMVDVTNIQGVQVGDEATLIGREGGEEITANEVAEWTGTVPYETVSSIGLRVSKIFLGKGKEAQFRFDPGERVLSSVGS
ncbi:alanine racemase [candidate division TA06 bacterium]|nr:alanine racemase [candidate division TA06 bacterium]